MGASLLQGFVLQVREMIKTPEFPPSPQFHHPAFIVRITDRHALIRTTILTLAGEGLLAPLLRQKITRAQPQAPGS